MNDILSKTLLYISFISIFILASCSSSSKTSRDYTRNSRSKTQIKKKRTNSSRIAKSRVLKPSKSKVTKRKSSKSTTRRAPRKAKVISDERNQVIYYANTLIGIPYIYGGKSSMGFDCSGFTSHVFTKRGLSLVGNTRSQSKMGRKLSLSKAQKGDLIFFGKSSKISHVAIIEKISANELIVIHSTSSKGVIRQDIKNSAYWTPKIMFALDVIDAKDKFASR